MFRRRRAKDPSSATSDFWRWWTSARQRIASAIESGNAASLAGEISGRVAAIHEDLQWELAKVAANEIARATPLRVSSEITYDPALERVGHLRP
jgi:hypothetical protein